MAHLLAQCVHLALLFGVITELLVSGSLLAKCAVVALVSGMYSNRLLIFTYDITGYAFPAVFTMFVNPFVATVAKLALRLNRSELTFAPPCGPKLLPLFIRRVPSG